MCINVLDANFGYYTGGVKVTENLKAFIFRKGAGEIKNKYLADLKGYYLRHKNVKKKWVPVYAQTSDHTAKVVGIPLKEFYNDALKFVAAQISLQSYYDFDAIRFTNDVYDFEAEALGAKLVYSDNVMPSIDARDPLIKKPSDLSKLKTPDFLRDGRFPYQLEIFRKKKEMGINQGTFCGPLSLAVTLRSYQLLINDLIEDPAFVKDLMHFIIDQVTMPYIKVVNKYLGITEFRGSDATATIPLFSPAILEDVILPWNLAIIKKGLDIGVNSFVFCPGLYGEELPEQFDYSIMSRCYDFSLASMGESNVLLRIGRHPDYPLDPFLKYALDLKSRYPKGPVEVAIRVYPRLLRNGPIEKIIHYIKNMLDIFCPGFQVSVYLTDVCVDTPPEHIYAAVQSTHYYGKLPYKFIDDDASFQPKKRESYSDFIDSMKNE